MCIFVPSKAQATTQKMSVHRSSLSGNLVNFIGTGQQRAHHLLLPNIKCGALFFRSRVYQNLQTGNANMDPHFLCGYN